MVSFNRDDSVWMLVRPDAVALTVCLAIAYVLLHRLSRKDTLHFATTELYRNQWFHHMAYALGLLLLYVAQGPLADLSETKLFTAYIIQMLLMTMALPWLLVFSLPPFVFTSILSIEWCKRSFHLLVHPAFALVTFNALVSLTLIPPILSLILTVNWVHMLEQMILFLSAVFFWWPIASPVPEVAPLTRGRKLFYIAYSSNFMMPIIFLLFLADHPWYSIYLSASNTRLPLSFLSIEGMADQQLGSLVMLVTMYVIYGAIAIRLYVKQDESIWYA
ncbi:cytochrome c oxidase assembly protein [Sulfoacidibacillus ferrooxidans]|uniref:Cytochrome c oxidase assembly protein n=1 Tax=Sulfoacidibacillus ferrooxidans TaxID=2005001 RepID=A0A9X2ADF2_9BACL|nr:cytochrome c oxidase assembly protein [Sulfoacidibacillus ferrooxidans]MCI0182171.1 hypothetical protein [Sulfoacidibacillus ferrooxidans]